MADLDLTMLKKRGLSILRMTADEWSDLEDSRNRGTRFTSVFPHVIARAGKSRAPVLLAIEAGLIHVPESYHGPPAAPAQLKLAWIKSIQAVATRESRVSFDYIQTVAPNTLEALVGDDVPSRLKASASDLLEPSGHYFSLGQKFGEWLLDRLAVDPANDRVLRRLIALVDRPAAFRNAVALQQDALGLALRAFGAPAAEATALALSRRTTALAAARVQENLVIAHDARWIPGWTLDDSAVTGRAVFHQGRHQLDVFTANHEDLERLFGVDLIYLNQTRRAIVMVQYKMMEPLPRRERKVEGPFGLETRKEGAEWVVPINDQFKEEISRMVRFDQPAGGGAGSYRLNSSPFFLKLVRRNGSTSGAGILLSLGHLRQLMKEGQLDGPRGGLRIAYSELDGHYLRSESFVELVQSGYIGSHSATTDHLEAMIDATLAGGRAVVAAIQSLVPDEGVSDYDPTEGM